VWGRGYVLRDAPEPLGAATAVAPGATQNRIEASHDSAAA
jgi:hypothetical protein